MGLAAFRWLQENSLTPGAKNHSKEGTLTDGWKPGIIALLGVAASCSDGSKEDAWPGLLCKSTSAKLAN